MSSNPGQRPQVAVLDTGGQYCHLITRKIRELGVYAEIRASETPAAALAGFQALVISGGPSSVYEAGSPDVDPTIFALGIPVLGICYGQQLLAKHLGGVVEPGQVGEYGMAHLDTTGASPLFTSATGRQTIWMSHRDTVTGLPPGFDLLGSTETCRIAAIGDAARRLYGVQFHPEVVHTQNGRQVLTNFLFSIAGLKRDWDPTRQLERIEDEIRRTVGERSVFFFVSGGVDSTVAFTLCLRALGPERVHAAYVDTGLMREGETEFVRGIFPAGVLRVEDARDRFIGALRDVIDPEQKRRIIGELFVEVQETILESGHYLEGNWILGQGTIYPDTIESGGTAKADLIKTHHNRVAGIQRLMEAGRIIEPLHLLYKDEVREVGTSLGLPHELLYRHPFPGPGLAIRCLCSGVEAGFEATPGGHIVPVKSVGVQGDSRSYRNILLLSEHNHDRATEMINRDRRVNRVVSFAAGDREALRVRPAGITAGRLDRLRRADAIVRALCHESGFEGEVWQFPVILIPVGTADRPDSIVLRPIHSVDGMTARSVDMPAPLLARMTSGILAVPGIAAVFYDLTHKPPGTIEWE